VHESWHLPSVASHIQFESARQLAALVYLMLHEVTHSFVTVLTKQEPDPIVVQLPVPRRSHAWVHPYTVPLAEELTTYVSHAGSARQPAMLFWYSTLHKTEQLPPDQTQLSAFAPDAQSARVTDFWHASWHSVPVTSQ